MKAFTAKSTPADHAVYWIKDLHTRNRVSVIAECSKGCHYCCHQIVSITIFEAIRLANGLEELNESDLSAVHSRAALNVDANNKTSSDEDRWKLRKPCSLLKGESCSVYEHRPLACIATHSVNRAHCIDQFNDKETKHHLAPMVRIDELSIEGILNYQISLAVRNQSDLRNLFSESNRKGLIIDLDRFIHFYCIPKPKERERRMEMLVNFDTKTLFSLEKQTE